MTASAYSRGCRKLERSALAAGVALALTMAASFAPAAPLDEKTCSQLKLEIGQLEGLGARDSLAKGAIWGKANLGNNQLEQVKKLIEMDEAVQFRCPRPKPVVQVVEPPVAGKGKVIAKVLPKAQAKPKDKAEPGKAVQTPDTAARQKAKAKAPAGQAADGSQAQPSVKVQVAPPVAQAPPKPRPRIAQPKAPDPAAAADRSPADAAQ